MVTRRQQTAVARDEQKSDARQKDLAAVSGENLITGTEQTISRTDEPSTQRCRPYILLLVGDLLSGSEQVWKLRIIDGLFSITSRFFGRFRDHAAGNTI